MKNKNLFGVLAMAALAFTGCSTDEAVNDYSPENAIQFGTYIGRDAQARASVITTESLKTSEGFGVFAYYSGTTDYTSGQTFTPNFMNNQQVTWDSESSSWSYTPLKYWPNNANDKVSFIAYAPYDESFAFNTSNLGTKDFTVADEVTEQIDFLWTKSQNFNKTKDNVDDVNDKVVFTFAHALAKIGFTINAGIDLTTEGGALDEHTTIYVDKVTIASLNNTGTLDMSKETATWSNVSGSQTYTWDYVKDGTNNELKNNVLTSDTEFGEGKEKQLINDNAFLMTIPQTPAEVTITVTYRVFTKDSKLTDTVTEQPGVTGSLVTNVIPVTLDNQTYVAGTAYTYNIILGMTSVKLDVDVAAWTDSSQDVWFDENNEDNDSNV